MATAAPTKLPAQLGLGDLRLVARGLAWLALLGPFFFLSYGFANWITSERVHVPALAFAWEHRAPFVPWTIIPYWSSDLLYAVSFFTCRTQRELDTHAKRLLAVQIICVVCFLLFPLRCLFARPETSGIFETLFSVLNGFDKPFNQAPSLHVSLAVVLWACFSQQLGGFWRLAMGAWLVLVGVSTMTTWQHQFIDLPTGVLAGCLAIALFPNKQALSRRGTRFRLATFYLSGSVFCSALASRIGGVGYVLLWPAAALLLTTVVYAADRPRVFQKCGGLIATISAPYTAGALLNSRWWTRNGAAAVEITGGVWLGRVPASFDRIPQTFESVVNVSAELPSRRMGTVYRNVPMLDLITPTQEQLRDAVAAIEDFERQRPTLVCCALGFSRSVTAVAAWLVWTGQAECAEEAIQRIRLEQPRVAIGQETAALINKFARPRARAVQP